MATTRVTQGLMIARTLDNLQNTTRSLLQFQEQLATGRRVVRVSDDPLAARLAISTRSQIQQNEQFIDNIISSTPPVLETGTSILNVVQVIQRTKELSLQAANGTLSQSQLNAVAEEIDQLLEQTVNIANHQTNERYIFAGTRTGEEPFVATRDGSGTITSIAYVGNDESINLAISDTITLQINETGESAFQPAGGVDILQLLIDVRDDMRTGNTGNLQTVRQAEIDDGLSQILSSVARNGSIANRLDRTQNATEDINIELHGTLSDAIDADIAETIIGLNAKTNAYQAALNASARVLQPSLLDFIR